MRESTSLFTTHTHNLSGADTPVLSNHPQLPLMINILSRKDHHHIAFNALTSKTIFFALLEGLAYHLKQNTTPKNLHNARCIYFDYKKLLADNPSPEKIAHDFLKFSEELALKNQRIIVALDQLNHDDNIGKHFYPLLNHPHWRFILLNDSTPHFSTVSLIPPSASQHIALLGALKITLEKFHAATITDEALAAALSMAQRYLPQQNCFDESAKLLDSAAAHVNTMESNSIVTAATVATIVSNTTQIPRDNLSNTIFQTTKLFAGLQRKIFGQDAALQAISNTLQQAGLRLKNQPGPLCSFLWVGPSESGKTSTADALNEYLFGHANSLININLSEQAGKDIIDIQVMNAERHTTDLLSAVRQMPYAILLFENIHQASAASLEIFKNIFSQGYALDKAGNRCNFQNTIVIATTHLGSEHLATLTQATRPHETNKNLDLIQLVLNSQTENYLPLEPQLSTAELREELTPILAKHFPAILLQHMHIIPFMTLDCAALEKIMRLKMKIFDRHLENHFNITLKYAPEVIKFLAHEALWQKPPTQTLEKFLEHHVYSMVANEILTHAESKSQQLSIQLHAQGQLLRCEFINITDSVYNS